MEFSDMLLRYIQKYYSPVGTRIIHILIILSIAVSLSIFLLNSKPSEILNIVTWLQIVFMVMLVLIVALNQQNSAVSKMEHAIFLNSDLIDKFDEKNKKLAFEKINDVFSITSKFKSKMGYSGMMKDCLKFLDPDNKSSWNKKQEKN